MQWCRNKQNPFNVQIGRVLFICIWCLIWESIRVMSIQLAADQIICGFVQVINIFAAYLNQPNETDWFYPTYFIGRYLSRLVFIGSSCKRKVDIDNWWCSERYERRWSTICSKIGHYVSCYCICRASLHHNVNDGDKFC